MAKRNIFQGLLNPETSIQRNGFDLSHRKVFTAKVGELLPILCEDLLPGDHFEVDTSTLVRSMPLNTAAFMRTRMVYDFIWVPKSAVWRNWHSFIYQKKSLDTSYRRGYAYEPNVTLAELHKMVNFGQISSPWDSKESRAKILSLLGYGDGLLELSPTDYGSHVNDSLTALPIYAYNRIYNMVYRNSWRDEPTSALLRTYSADDLDCSSYSSSLVSATGSDVTMKDFVRVHYRGVPKDIFMGSLPNQQFGTVSSIAVRGDSSGLGPVVNGHNAYKAVVLDRGGDTYLSGVTVDTLPDGTKYGSINGYTTGRVGLSFDVMQLRRALALQKWKEANMRAGWRAKNQQDAMFGTNLPSDPLHEVYFIDSYEAPFMVDEVMSTANTSSPDSGNGNLGEIGGKGIGVANGKRISFDAKCHGYLFCIFSIVPEMEYDAEGIDRTLVRSEPFDHFTPAFQNLGLQPVFRHELTSKGSPDGFSSPIGYAPYGYEYKTRVDKVYGPFARGKSLSAWVATRRDLESVVVNTPGQLPTSAFYVHPSVLDPVFVKAADEHLDSDQFLVNCNFRVSAVRPMSVLGLPNF